VGGARTTGPAGAPRSEAPSTRAKLAACEGAPVSGLARPVARASARVGSTPGTSSPCGAGRAHMPSTATRCVESPSGGCCTEAGSAAPSGCEGGGWARTQSMEIGKRYQRVLSPARRGVQLYGSGSSEHPLQRSTGKRKGGRRPGFPHERLARACAAGPKPSSRARLLLGILGRTDNLQTALGLCQGCFFPERSPKSSVRRDRSISTRKKRDTA